MSIEIPSIEDIQQAHQRIQKHIHPTPILTSRLINAQAGGELFFKCENFQKAGAFKFRGASNAVFSLSEKQARQGVATHSSGNHAQAVALAAKKRGIPAHIVMPENAPVVKKRAVADYGGQITECKPTLDAREKTLEQLVEKTGATFIHPYNDPRIIAGQGTAAMELLEEVKDLDMILTPVGGGGLLSGTAITMKNLHPSGQVTGTEPKQADDAYRSFKAGKLIPVTDPDTVADGLRTSLGPLTFSIISRYADDIVTVSEDSIIKAMRLIWERMNIIIEPSSAVPLAAILEQSIDVEGLKAGIIISGGNVDLEHLPWQKL